LFVAKNFVFENLLCKFQSEFIMNKILCIIAFVFYSLNLFAQPILFELPNGRKIVIKENKTWDYEEASVFQSNAQAARDIWESDKISIDVKGWRKMPTNVRPEHKVTYVNEANDSYFSVYEEVVDLNLSDYVELSNKAMKISGIENFQNLKQLVFMSNGRNHMQQISSGTYNKIPSKYVHNFYRFTDRYVIVVGWTLGRSTASIEDLKNRIQLKR